MEKSVNVVLQQLARSRGINVRQWDFHPPLNGFYWEPLKMPPVIVLDNKLKGEKLNRVFAHELGHSQLMEPEDGDLMRCKDKLKVMRAEKQADAFAEMLIEGIKLALLEREVLA